MNRVAGFVSSVFGAQPAGSIARFERLDVWRGVAIIAVFGYHLLAGVFGGVDHLPFVEEGRDYAAAPHPSFLVFYGFTFGWVGVILFFVISGFCIHWSFLRWQNQPARPTSFRRFTAGFYWRRFWRIYPPYLVALLFWAIYSGYSLFSLDHLAVLLPHAAMLHNFHSGHFFAIYPPFWSIAVELQLYLVYPLVLLLYRRFGVTSLLALVIVGLAYRFAPWKALVADEGIRFAIRQAPFSYWPQWLLGALVAELVMRRVRPPALLPLLLLGMGCAFFWLAENRGTFGGGEICAATAFAAIIWMVGMDERPLGSFERLLAFTGVASYSLYMYHGVAYPAVNVATRHFGTVWAGLTFGALCMFLLLTLGSWCLHRLVEKPSERLGAVLWKSIGRVRQKAPRMVAAPEPSLTS